MLRMKTVIVFFLIVFIPNQEPSKMAHPVETMGECLAEVVSAWKAAERSITPGAIQAGCLIVREPERSASLP